MSKYSRLKHFHNFLKFQKDFRASSVQKLRGYEVALLWVRSVLSRSHFLILSGMLIGCTAGRAGVTDTWNLPVVDEGRYVGFISKSNILNRYRDLLKKYS